MRKRFGIRVKLILVVIPVVLALIFSFFALSTSMLVRQAKENLVSESLVYTGEIEAWAEGIVKEINVYVDVINAGIFADDGEVLRYMENTVDRNDSYPAGLYMGDDNGVYLDASGWVPDEDWVLVERDWYIEGKEHETLAFGEPYYDSQSGQVCVSASVKMDYAIACRVLAADIYLDDVSAMMSEITIGDSGKAFLVTRGSQTVLAHPDASMIDVKLNDGTADSFYQNVGRVLQNQGSGLREIKGDSGTYFVCIHNIGQTDWCLVTYISKADVLSDLRKLQVIMACIALIAAIVLIVVITWIMNQVVRPVKQVTDVLSMVAEGDFSKNIATANAGGNDEIAGMSSSMQMFLEKMRRIISDISGTADWLNQQAQENGTVSESLKASAGEQSNAMTVLGEMVRELSDTANQAAEGMENLAEIIHRTRSEGEDAGIVMQETVKASKDGHDAMEKIRLGMNGIEETMTSLERQIKQTEEAVAQIGSMVGLIVDIAEETNLLSLNATIEAARAGEAGKGFAVVAEQIGRLAENSGVAADDISKLTVDIRETVNRAAAHMEESVDRVRESTVLIETATKTFDGVFSQVEKTDAMVGNMVLLVDEVDTLASRMMGTAKEQLHVTEEINHSAGLLDTYTRTVNDNSESVAESARALKEQSGRLSESMDQFTL